MQTFTSEDLDGLFSLQTTTTSLGNHIAGRTGYAVRFQQILHFALDLGSFGERLFGMVNVVWRGEVKTGDSGFRIP